MNMLTKNVKRMIRGPGATTWKTQTKTKKITAEYENIVNPPSVFPKLFSEDELRAGEVQQNSSGKYMNCDIEYIPLTENHHDETIVENLLVVVPANQISDIMEMVADNRSMCQITLNEVNSIVEHSMNKLVLVGGSDCKNLIRRCLQQIEDELAQYCSWAGQKRNFKISDFKMMDILEPSVKTVFNATTIELNKLIVMDWMRFAKQRLKRKE
ncbi:hypothetical protein JTB14_003250 [Gonioctena quinquepunctata]|nr:hypothetical protein JTB14_003250 [Gonioctena quinquepunctata]